MDGLQDARHAVARVVDELGFESYAFESYGAEAKPPVDGCLAKVRECDVFVAILGDAYGTVPARSAEIAFADGETSISEIELRSAALIGKPTLIYLREGSDPEPRQGAFIASLQGLYAQSTMSSFMSAENLHAQLRRDLPRLITQLIRRTYRHPTTGAPQVHVFPAAHQVFAAAANDMHTVLAEKLWPVLTLGCGRTAAGVYGALVGLDDKRGSANLANARFVGQTEYLGYLPDHPNTCVSHLRAGLIDKIRKGRPPSTDRDIFLPSVVQEGTIEAACRDIDARLDHEVINLSIFGCSRQGEVLCIDATTARSERQFDLGTRVVTLLDESRLHVIPQPYLPQVVTIGFRNLLRSERMIAVLTGTVKANVLRQLVNGPVEDDCPITLLRSSGHGEFYVYADKAAARDLSSRDPNIVWHER